MFLQSPIFTAAPEIDPFDSEEDLEKHIYKCHPYCVSWSKELNPIQNRQNVALSQS